MIGSVLGNRTPDSAVRGLRLNLLTNTPYSLIIYAVQRKIYYTEEPPSCPVLFLFFSKLFLRGLFLRVNCKSNFTELNAKCRSIYLGISLDLHILGVLMNDVILLLPS